MINYNMSVKAEGGMHSMAKEVVSKVLQASAFILQFCTYSNLASAKPQKPAVTASSSASPELPFPERGQALEAVESSLQNLVRFNAELILLPMATSSIIRTPFTPEVKDAERVFGTLLDSKRVEMPPELTRARWVGAFKTAKNILLFDGSELGQVSLELEKWGMVTRRSLVFDLIRPAPDRGGEATSMETEALRKIFLRQFTKLPNPEVMGVAPVPKGWWRSSGHAFMALTRAQSFPLTLIECSKDDISQCQMTRACSATGFVEARAEHRRGIGISEKHKLLVVGDAETNELIFYKFSACNSIRRMGSLRLPAKLKKLAGVSVDVEDNLWITTEAMDDYLNASAYYWPEKSWRALLP